MGGRETQPPLGAKRRGKRSSERPGGGGRRPGAKGAVSHRAPPAPGPPRRRAGPPAGTGPPPPPAAAASSHGVRIRAGPRRAAGVGAGATGEDNKDILHIHSCWAGGARRGAGGRPGRARGGRGGARGGGEHNAGGRRGPSGPRLLDTRAAPPGLGAGAGSGWGTLLAAGRTRGWRPAPGHAGGPRGAEPGGHGPGPSAAPCSCPGQRPDPSLCLWLGAARRGPCEVAFGL